MTIIELFNKIANGEEVPRRIRYEDSNYCYSENLKQYYKGGNEEELDTHYTNSLRYFLYNFESLNDEIEIIEDNKIPEKLSTWFSLETGRENDNVQYANYNFESEYKKINEIIDYLNSREDKK